MYFTEVAQLPINSPVSTGVSLEGAVYVATQGTSDYPWWYGSSDQFWYWTYKAFRPKLLKYGHHQWEEVGVQLRHLSGFALGASNERIFLVGGLHNDDRGWGSASDGIYEIDLALAKARIVGKLSQARIWLGALVLDDEWLYAIGGGQFWSGRRHWHSPSLSSVEAFNLETKKLKQQANMNEARTWPAVATFDGTIFVAGGARWTASGNGVDRVLATAEYLHPPSGKWILLHETLKVPRAGAGMVLSHGQFLVFGGLNWNNELRTYQSLEDVEVLPSNASTKSSLETWRKHLHGKLMSEPRAWFTAVKASNSEETTRVFLVGGLTDPSQANSTARRVEVWSLPNLTGAWFRIFVWRAWRPARLHSPKWVWGWPAKTEESKNWKTHALSSGCSILWDPLC